MKGNCLSSRSRSKWSSSLISNHCNVWSRRSFIGSFDRKTLLDDEAKAQKLISVKYTLFNLNAWNAWFRVGFHFEMHKTAALHSNLLLSWELVIEGYQEKTFEIYTFQVEMHAFRKTLTRHGNSLVTFLAKLHYSSPACGSWCLIILPLGARVVHVTVSESRAFNLKKGTYTFPEKFVYDMLQMCLQGRADYVETWFELANKVEQMNLTAEEKNILKCVGLFASGMILNCPLMKWETSFEPKHWSFPHGFSSPLFLTFFHRIVVSPPKIVA